MRTRNILLTLALCGIFAASVALWTFRYPALYYYYLWRLDHTKWVEDLQEDIESIAPHIVPLLVRTYEDVNASPKRRHAAAYGLIKADRKRAESLFVRFLDNENDEIVRLAIWDLAVAKSDQAFVKIVKLANHPNVRIREAVDFYLEHFSDVEALSRLVAPEDDQAFGRTVELSHHPNAKIRLAVINYLANVDNAEAVSVLKEMEANDSDERVRAFAEYRLQRLGGSEH